MSKGSGLGLAKVLGEVSKINTDPAEGREQIEYIDIGLIDPDPRNFYKLSDLDELVQNIELLGLQQPLLVRTHPEKPERVIVVSGHRRREAILKLVEEGNEKFRRKVPCIRERNPGSAAWQELCLIYANAATRQITSPELATQAERVTELLYRLKEEGIEFPGRMREHVAQACQTTASKLARLKVIRKKLHPLLKADWERGEINDSVAYCIAKESERVQNQLFADNGHAPRNWTADRAEMAIGKIKNPPPAKPVDFWGMDAKNRASEYLDARAEEDRWYWDTFQEHILPNFIKSFCLRLARHDGIAELKRRYQNAGYWGEVRYYGTGSGLKIYHPGKNHTATRTWTEVWDMMAAIALQRCAAEQNEPENDGPTGQLVFSGWMPGGTNPATPCDAVVVFDLDGKHVKRLCRWNGRGFTFPTSDAEVTMKPIKWMALPPDEEET